MDIPDDTLHFILDFLPVHSLFTLRLVSKKFKEWCNKKVVKALRKAFHPDLVALFPHVAIRGLPIITKIIQPVPLSSIQSNLVFDFDHETRGKAIQEILHLEVKEKNLTSVVNHLRQYGWHREDEIDDVYHSHYLMMTSPLTSIWGYKCIFITFAPNGHIRGSMNVKDSWFNGSVLYIPRSAELLNLDHSSIGPVIRANLGVILSSEIEVTLLIGFTIRRLEKAEPNMSSAEVMRLLK
jgi:hypothetical protein